ncbi:MAG TPA: hypothetical protein VH575_19485 [Gemmataceae bacterium]|jgi:hypothetical protein
MVEPKLLRIEWEGPLSIDAVRSKTGDNDYGLYQIYSHHLIFGAGALVYIGKAERQTFADRLDQHWEGWLKWESDVSIRLGRLSPADYRVDDNWQEWSQLLSDAEKLSVYWYTPPYNSHYISPNTEFNSRALWIQNWGNRGSLLPEYSSHWKPLRPDDTIKE